MMLKLSLISLILIPLLGLSQSANAKLVFSDTHNLVKVLNAGMATAKRHVDLITPELKNDKLHKLLLKTSNRSVRIRIITNKTLASTRQAEALEKNHIDVRYAPINVQYGFVIDGIICFERSILFSLFQHSRQNFVYKPEKQELLGEHGV